MKRLYSLWVIIPALVALTAYGVSSGEFRRWSSKWLHSHSVIECPNTLYFGERELGELAITRFSISNHGGRQLVIEDVQTSCACSGLEQEQDGRLVRLQTLRVEPRTSVKLVMRAVVQGAPGAPARYVVTFRTNDPTKPEYAIEGVVSKVKAGVVAYPNSISFGKLSLNSEARRTIDIYDESVNERRVSRVVSGNTGQVNVRVIDDPKPPADSRSAEFGKWIGRIEVEAMTSVPRRIETDVEVRLTGAMRPPTLIRVSARVLGPVEILPSIVMLPRSSDAGWIYSSRSLCRSTNGNLLELSVESRPDDLTVSIEPLSLASEKSVVIEWDHTRAEKETGNPRKVRLVVRTDDQETVVEVPVYCIRKGPTRN